jgi:hypothetical protein
MSEPKITTASNVLGTIGTVLWCVQLVPQIVYNWRRKSCEGLPHWMMFLWAASGVPFAVYFIVQQANIPVQVQPHVFMALCLLCWSQCLIYPPIKMRKLKAMVLVICVVVAFAGIEAGCIVPFRNLYREGVHWPVTMIGIIAAVLIAVGLLPPYFELYKRGGQVVGINFIFLVVDSSGALFSLLSLVTQGGPLDVLGCVSYIAILAMEVGIFLSQGIWLLRTRKARKEAKLQKVVDDEDNVKNAAIMEERIDSNDLNNSPDNQV